MLGFTLFVDFFFVLSGFVIASAYQSKLSSGDGVIPFALRRFGRLYPLHIATLAALVTFALARTALAPGPFNPRDMFDGWMFDFSALFTNVLLVHGLGFESHLTWNFPSWSISTEFYTYLVFAMIWRARRLSRSRSSSRSR